MKLVPRIILILSVFILQGCSTANLWRSASEDYPNFCQKETGSSHEKKAFMYCNGEVLNGCVCPQPAGEKSLKYAYAALLTPISLAIDGSISSP